MSRVWRSTDRVELSGEGSLVEGDRVVGQVTYEVARRKKPSGLYSAEGTFSAPPDSEVDFFDLLNRNAPLVLTFPGGSWECYLQHYNPQSNTARAVNRGRLLLDDDDTDNR